MSVSLIETFFEHSAFAHLVLSREFEDTFSRGCREDCHDHVGFHMLNLGYKLDSVRC